VRDVPSSLSDGHRGDRLSGVRALGGCGRGELDRAPALVGSPLALADPDQIGAWQGSDAWIGSHASLVGRALCRELRHGGDVGQVTSVVKQLMQWLCRNDYFYIFGIKGLTQRRGRFRVSDEDLD
jgi:hypothetical protein